MSNKGKRSFTRWCGFGAGVFFSAALASLAVDQVLSAAVALVVMFILLDLGDR